MKLNTSKSSSSKQQEDLIAALSASFAHENEDPVCVPEEEDSASTTPSCENDGADTTRSDEPSSETTPAIASKEARAVFASKFLVAFVLLLSAGVLAYISFVYTRNEEDNEFQTKFLDYADEIARSSVNNARNSFRVLQSFSRTVTSIGNFANETWPFLILPDFEVRAHDFQSISGAEEVAFAPIVSDQNREAWELYTTQNQDWIQTGLDYEYLTTLMDQTMEQEEPAHEEDAEPIAPGTNMEGFSVINKAKPIQEYIWRHAPLTHRAIPEITKGPHVPIWQTYPAPRNAYVVNHNLRSVPEFEHLITTAINAQTSVLSDVIDNFALFGRAQTIDLDPKSVAVEPVFQQINHHGENENEVKGFLIVIKKWDVYFRDVLYKGAEPLVCVLKNTCGKAFSYEIIGPNAIFLGEGDLHDTDYDDMVLVADFSHGPHEHHRVESACNFTIEVYPTKQMEQAHKTNMPIYVTLVVLVVFGFTSLVFLLYDYMVAKRQQKTQDSANATNRIVSNLFPKAVRERLIKEMEVQDARDEDDTTGITGMSSVSKGGMPTLSRRISQGSKTKKRRQSSVFGGGSSSFLSNGSAHGSNQDASAAAAENQFGTSEAIFGSKPIAELFPETTIMFADMVGFTAWSSVREPTQVFTLLETIYHAFDTIAKRRRVFKVETIGDCYVAVAGLPMPRKDHAVVMARFSSECLAKMDTLTRNLEATLGPDTGDLSLRVGLHSGPVTAGVLRGEKGRFQLFGDTMNTASRMESTGVKEQIQCSSETAALLHNAGKARWITERTEKVHAKGKGELLTFWLSIKTGSDNDTNSEIRSTSELEHQRTSQSDELLKVGSCRMSGGEGLMRNMARQAKCRRLIEWNSEILAKLLKQIVLRRVARKVKKKQLGLLGVPMASSTPAPPADTSFEATARSGPIDEVQDIIMLPHYDPKAFAKHVDPDSVEIPDSVFAQLAAYVSRIADLYRDNPFHNFEHASHVTMSVTKLMSRIVNPLQVDGHTSEQNKMLHDHTFGITSDPLTQFASVLSALIHDADHPGVSNTVLVNENDPLAAKYNAKSVAEQNSVDLAWSILMEDTFEELRSYIYTSEDEFLRFRQILVNVVLATDIMDKEMGAARKARWEKAFSSAHLRNSLCLNGHLMNEDVFRSSTASNEGEAQLDVNRKATIVLEHLIQASDVSHTMQHWHVFRKWNQRLFDEVYQAYLEGRMDKDPSEGWYKGEIGFFDFYIIPLAKKLETCGVFGVSSHEYLGYAAANRREWEIKGESIVKEYLAKYEQGSGASGQSLGSHSNKY